MISPSKCWNWITDKPTAIYFLIFLLSVAAVVYVSLPDYSPDFWVNIKVEAHGMIFDILVLGLLFSWLHSRGEKQRQIQRYIEEIDDFRDWHGEESKLRIRGNILRLNKLGVHNIDLHGCYLKGVRLEKVNLKGSNMERVVLDGADLTNVNFEGANLENTSLVGAFMIAANLKEANLKKANLEDSYLVHANFERARLDLTNFDRTHLADANLKSAFFLKSYQLCKARSLHGTKLDPDREKAVKSECPKLFEVLN